MNTKAGSYLEFTVPWITEEMGYVSKVNGQLMHLDATTSLQFRSLLECETLEVRPCCGRGGFSSEDRIFYHY